MPRWNSENSGDKHPNWRGDDAKVRSKRKRAQKMYSISECEICNDDATDRHHISGDVGDNRRENLIFLCRRCHMTIDGRLDKLRAIPRHKKPEVECIDCSAMHKGTRNGRCHKCDEFLRRNGVPRPKDFIDTTTKYGYIFTALSDAGLSYRKIGDIVGVNASTVLKGIRKYGRKGCHDEQHK